MKNKLELNQIVTAKPLPNGEDIKKVKGRIVKIDDHVYVEDEESKLTLECDIEDVKVLDDSPKD